MAKKLVLVLSGLPCGTYAIESQMSIDTKEAHEDLAGFEL